MDINVQNTATIKLTKKELIETLNNRLPELLGLESELADYTVTDVKDVQETHSEPGIDPHDAFYYDVFNGIEITLKKG